MASKTEVSSVMRPALKITIKYMQMLRRTGDMQRLIGDSSGCQKIKRREDHLRNEFQMAVSRMEVSLALLLAVKIKVTAIYQ